MFEKIASFFEGERRFRVYTRPAEAASFFIRSGVRVTAQSSAGGVYECTVGRRDGRLFEAVCKRNGWAYTVLYERGAAVTLRKAALRPGLIVGILLGILLIWSGSRRVWQIEIAGNEKLTREEVLDILKEEGFFIGCRFTALDLDAVCGRIPQKRKEIAWISVNMMGSVAEVVLFEAREKNPAVGEDDSPCNLVARLPGQIVRFELSRGRPVVSVGQTVDAGQLLVAGYSEKETGPNPRPSCGRVYAKVVLEEETTVPFVYAQYSAGEPFLFEKKANILGKEIFFSKKGLQSGEKYDIVKDEYRPTVLGVALPFTVEERRARLLTEITATRTPAEAYETAKAELMQRLRASSDEILSVSYSSSESADGLTVRAVAVCVVDVAERQAYADAPSYTAPVGAAGAETAKHRELMTGRS